MEVVQDLSKVVTGVCGGEEGEGHMAVNRDAREGEGEAKEA